MDTSSHISLEILADIAEERVPGALLDAALAHVSTCSECDTTLRRLRQLIHTMKSDRGADAPRDVLLSTINIFSPRQSPLRRVVAILTFDSRNASPAYGMRSIHANSRQMLYSAQETDLDLRITVQNDECIVAGQIMRDGCTGGVVQISGASGSAEASLNELCEFTLPAVPVGNYSLTVRMLDVEIEIPELELKD
ncbi:MAG TPA: hypothetical protein VF290_10225 [Pyrinomonadaceae bacterium]